MPSCKAARWSRSSVPCYNEAARSNVPAFTAFVVSQPAVRLVLVNDGSADRTLDRLNEIRAADCHRVVVIDLERNVGKAAFAY